MRSFSFAHGLKMVLFKFQIQVMPRNNMEQPSIQFDQPPVFPQEAPSLHTQMRGSLAGLDVE